MELNYVGKWKRKRRKSTNFESGNEPTLKLPANSCAVLFIAVAFAVVLHPANSIGWLSLGMSGTSMGHIGPSKCRSISGFNKRQIRMCRQNSEHMDSVRVGAQNALMECQYQFRERRWNCTMVDHISLFGNALKEGTREAAFVHSLSAAGVAHSVTGDCSRGRLEKCGCDQSIKGRATRDFRWAGCSDNVHYGIAFSRAFVDAHERRKRQSVGRMLMNLHNNEAGRVAVDSNMRVQCKCHGVSGSCELKTCWRAMPTFRQVGDILKQKFDGATEVKLVKRASRQLLAPLNPYFKAQTPQDLVYLANSPDYCDRDADRGVVGTRGRQCNKTSAGIDGCELLCCHRGFRSNLVMQEDVCDCKFHWCCHVKCRSCPKPVEINTCL